MFHSQDNQDNFLESSVFKGYKNGIFVDVGAHDGVSINNTLYFERVNGWTGINIEPIPSIYKKLVLNRPSCINLNLAIDNKEGQADFFLNIGYTEMISGLSSAYDSRHGMRLAYENSLHGSKTEKIIVPTRRLDSIFEEYHIDKINYLSIDVEGAEENVIKSIDFDKVFIDVIGFENNYIDRSIPIVNYLITKNYLPSSYRGLDIIMIHKDSKFR